MENSRDSFVGPGYVATRSDALEIPTQENSASSSTSWTAPAQLLSNHPVNESDTSTPQPASNIDTSQSSINRNGSTSLTENISIDPAPQKRLNMPIPSISIARSNLDDGDIKKSVNMQPVEGKVQSDARHHHHHHHHLNVEEKEGDMHDMLKSDRRSHQGSVEVMNQHIESGKSHESDTRHSTLKGMPSSKETKSNENVGQNKYVDDSSNVYSFDHFLVYTKAVEYPRLFSTICEKRFILRFLQSAFATSAFSGMFVAATWNHYGSAAASDSGLNVMCFTSITALFVSLCCMYLYAFPGSLGIPPHRHWRFSGVEVSIDAVLSLLWLGSSARLATYARCPENRFIPAPNGSGNVYMIDTPTLNCFAWPLSITTGFCCMAFHIVTLTMGIWDLQRQAYIDAKERQSHIMFARGNWKQ
ncbi:hypothetical protein BATDEDRAFT_89422 [Batrachochytrium dendrobatidis JAM81]|uniref:MARVEL domain-containing protein n=1 Tax=Batrachochytrium dendrobatidis (strain JAM81 / FGSC 10211) TaxID=684364 RepID=F4P454_BATDJ|nr:uncharacterized protein BATDEDRAFT_89422 [Batrachochytrium dendrobatidis JAM81]EGF79727.1 hypothetical protein BATDEDRAFT_89422 [Batrachochytrium dendrobatidis JAM81]|eukprot:XP_006679657.1 hypothetical protein BATDEDRAFT_89422 [Batrachochytrium dendrobatidis JAM81]